MTEKSKPIDLDFTGILNARTLEPVPPPLPKKMPEEIVIGAKALRKGGYFVNITPPDTAPANAPRRAGVPTVLIVEDEPSTLLLIDHVLAKAGYKTRKAGDGAGFVAAIRIPPVPDLILLDLEMPDISGFRILVKLRQHPQTQHVPVVILSAHSEPKIVFQGMTLGANGYISKPTKAGILLQAVKAVLGT
jgi:CheY-like chemotaxis protein